MYQYCLEIRTSLKLIFCNFFLRLEKMTNSMKQLDVALQICNGIPVDLSIVFLL
jgi:hypothetical protein